MMQDFELYDRQRRLPEVGAEGQDRIAAAELRVEGSDGAMVETLYLGRAGVNRLELASRLEPLPFAHERFFRFAASRRVGAGAWRALEKIRGVLASK
jgi:hypothetical protein